MTKHKFDTYYQVVRYVQGKMHGRELDAFEIAMFEDPSLVTEVHLYELFRLALTEYFERVGYGKRL